MVINNYAANVSKSPEKLIASMIETIPAKLMPENGIPKFNITNSLFHSYGVMFNEWKATGSKIEEEKFDFFRSMKVWAFSCLEKNDSGSIFLALKQRIDKRKEYKLPIELVIFHEIGHHYYYGKGVGLDLSNMIDFDHETKADIYGLACFINYYNTTRDKGYYEKINPDIFNKIITANNAGFNIKNMIKVSTTIIKTEGSL